MSSLHRAVHTKFKQVQLTDSQVHACFLVSGVSVSHASRKLNALAPLSGDHSLLATGLTWLHPCAQHNLVMSTSERNCCNQTADAPPILSPNAYAWNDNAHMLFLESPAGVGFSYSEEESDYVVGGCNPEKRCQ